MNVVEFLEARIAEDEALANGSIGMHWDGHYFQQVRTAAGDNPHYYKIASGQVPLEHWESKARVDPGTTFNHIARHDPARVLAECAAKRKIIAECREDHEDSLTRNDDTDELASLVLYALATVYKDHPDYREDWSSAT